MLSITLSWETWLINWLLNLSEARCCSLRSTNLSLFKFDGSRYGFSFMCSIYNLWFLWLIKFAFFFKKFISFMLSRSLNISNELLDVFLGEFRDSILGVLISLLNEDYFLYLKFFLLIFMMSCFLIESFDLSFSKLTCFFNETDDFLF